MWNKGNKREAERLIVKGVSLKRFSKGGDIQEDIRLWALDQTRKPPWQRFMDLNVSLAELLIAWEIGKWILGRKRQPEEAKQV